MKRNRLILTSGILMIIGAVACMVASIISGIYLIEFVKLMSAEVTVDSEVTLDFLYLTYLVTYALIVTIYMAEGVVFMVFGIKLIIKYVKKVPLDNYKNLVVIAQVLGYVAVLISMGSDMIVLSIGVLTILASSILLSVALSKNKKLHENVAYVNNVNNVNSADPKHTDSNVSIDERSYTNELMAKIKSLKGLKDSGVITDEEYSKMVHEVLGIDNSNEGNK